MLRLYIIGFTLSILLTIGAYLAVVTHTFSGLLLVSAVVILAFIQLLVQLFFFLHLGQESKPRWNLAFFVSTFGIILLVVIGSLWIMNHLNYNMNPQQMRQYIKNQDGI